MAVTEQAELLSCALFVLDLRSEEGHNAEPLKTLSPDSGTGKRNILCLHSTVVFPSWTSRVRVPSPAPESTTYSHSKNVPSIALHLRITRTSFAPEQPG